MQYSQLIARIQADIYNNGEQLITGNVLQGDLLAMVSALASSGAGYGGIITPGSSAPASIDQATFYLAIQPGTYSSFGVTVTEPSIVSYGGGSTLTFNVSPLGLAPAPTVVKLNTGDDPYVLVPLTGTDGMAFTVDIEGGYSGGTTEVYAQRWLVNYSTDNGATIYVSGDKVSTGMITWARVYEDNGDMFLVLNVNTSSLDYVTMAFRDMTGNAVSGITVEPNITGYVYSSDAVIRIPAGNGEDIDYNAEGLLQFADRPTAANQKGYVILRKNKTFAEQVTKENTIYEIRYEFTLEDDFQIPSGCVLDFRGGSIDGGHILDLNDCQILGTNEWIGTSLKIAGKTATPCFADWFKGSDADKVEKALDMFAVVHLNARDYLIGRQIVISHSFALYGDGFQDFFGKTSNTGDISDYSRSRLIATEQMDSILFLKKDSTISSFGSYTLNGVSFTTDASVQRTVNGVKISTPGGPSRPINIHCCNFRFLKYGLYITGSTSASSNSTNTLCLTITSCTISQNDWGIYIDGHHAVGLLCVDGCNVEQNITGGIYAYDATYTPVFCGIEIKNTLLEGQDTPIYLKSDGYVKLNSNYYERTSVTQTIHVEGPSYQNKVVVDITGEHGSNSTKIVYDLKWVCVKSFFIEGPSSASNGSVNVDANTSIFFDFPIIALLRTCTGGVFFPVENFDDEQDAKFGEIRIQGKQNTMVRNVPAMWSLPNGNSMFDNNVSGFTPGIYRAVFYIWVNTTADHYFQFRDITARLNYPDSPLYMAKAMKRLVKCVTDLNVTTTGTADIRLTYRNRGVAGALLGSSVGLFSTTTSIPKYRPQILSSGTTAQRPLATTFGAGFTYFDITLGRMIVSNGTDWVNMDGSALS